MSKMIKMISPDKAMYELERARIDSIKKALKNGTFKPYPGNGMSVSVLQAIEELQAENFQVSPIDNLFEAVFVNLLKTGKIKLTEEVNNAN